MEVAAQVEEVVAQVEELVRGENQSIWVERSVETESVLPQVT